MYIPSHTWEQKFLVTGNSEITAQQRCNVAIGKFNEHLSILTSTKLPIRMRCDEIY